MNCDVILENMTSGFLAVDSQGSIVRANGKALSMLRRTSRDVVGKTIWTTFSVGTDSERQLRQALEQRVEQRFQLFSPSLYNWFDVTSVPVDAAETYVFFTDVTDRERAIQSGAVQEALRRILLDAPIAISITRGPEHRYELTNTMARALVGGRNFEGMTIRNALPDVDPALFAMLDDVYRQGERITVSDLSVTYDREGDGRPYTGTFDITYQPLRDTAGVVTGIIITAVELTKLADSRRRERSEGRADRSSGSLRGGA